VLFKNRAATVRQRKYILQIYKGRGMNQQNQQPEKSNDQPRRNHWQYKFLKLCAKKGDEGIERWNIWREKHPNKVISLEEADLRKAYLRKANLSKANLYNAKLQKTICNFTNFERATLVRANLSEANLFKANLKDAKLGHVPEAELTSDKILQGIPVLVLITKGLEIGANLNHAILWHADLRGANLSKACIYGSDFKWATIDGATTIRNCRVNKSTDFRGVGLGNCKIDPATKQLLEYNIRRKNWEDWYPKHIILRGPVRWFWSLSDYGRSTGRIIGWFLGLAVGFAAIYSIFAFLSPPGIVSNLEVEQHLPLWHYFLLLILRPVYFSVVTMTTLGFGDMYANAQSIWGHIFLTIQVILGYVLLGALVTRFAVLFTAGGPAGKFADEKEKSKVKSKKAKPQIKMQKEE